MYFMYEYIFGVELSQTINIIVKFREISWYLVHSFE